MNILNKISSTNSNKKRIRVLDEFVRSNWNGVSQKESEENLKNSLIEIVYSGGQHCGNGLLISENGYFITANHCLESMTRKRIVTSDGTYYKKFAVCKHDVFNDVALAEIFTSKKFIPKKYNLGDTTKVENSAMALLTRWNGKISKKYGLLRRNYSIVKEGVDINGLHLNGISINGNSGGIVLNPQHELVGMVYGKTNANETTITKTQTILNLIYSYINELKNS